MAWRDLLEDKCMIIILDMLYIFELFINLLLVSRFWANRLYILIKDYIIM